MDLVRGQVGREGAPLAGAGTPMRRHKGVLLIQLDLPRGGTDPESLADEAVRRRVVGPGEDDMAVGVELGLLPLGQLPRGHGQRVQGRALDLVEDRQGNLLGRAVDTAAGGLHTPAEQMAIAVVEVAEGPTSQRVAFDVVDAALLDLAFVLGRPWPTGRDEKAVVLRELPVAALHLGVVERGVDDRGPEIVEHDAAGHAAEELERRPMQAQPGAEALVEDEFGVLVPAARQRHDERPGAPHPVMLGIPIQAAEPEVHLDFVPRVDFEAPRRARRRRRHAAQEALDRRVAAPEPVLLDEELPDRLALDALGVPGQHLLAERLDEGLLLGRPTRGRGREPLGQHGRLGQRPRQQPVPGGPLPVVRHGVAADLEVARDAARPLSQLQPSQDLSNRGHRTPPSRHAPSSETNVTSRRQSAPVGASTPRSPVTSRWVAHDARPWVAQHGRPGLAQDGRPRVAQFARPRWLTIGRPLTGGARSHLTGKQSRSRLE